MCFMFATGSEIAGEAAAALAAATLARANPDADYLTPAKQLYSFATGPAKGSYMNTNSLGIQIHAALYPSTVRETFPSLACLDGILLRSASYHPQ